MYIREVKTTNPKTKKVYTKLTLVESYTTEKGPRQRTIMNLGAVDIPRELWTELAYCLEMKLSGQQRWMKQDEEVEKLADELLARQQLKSEKQAQREKREQQEQIMPVDVQSLATIQTRSLGAEIVADKVWKQLGFDKILHEIGFTARQKALAKIAIIGRLCEPGSEHNLYRWFQKRSALNELLDEDLSDVGKDGFYDIADELLAYKEQIEQSLYHNETKAFSTRERVFLYDLTNTYFEGQCADNTLAHRGHSKEKRTDCPLVTLALVVDAQGFAVMSQIYKGNQSEPATLEDILNRLEADMLPILSCVKPMMIMDRGIATQENMALLVERGYPYTLIERRSEQQDFLSDFEDLSAFEQVGQDDETVYLKKTETDTGIRVLCCSYKRRQKERSMDRKKETHFLQTLASIQRQVKNGRLKRKEKVYERIGRAKQKYPTIWKYYDIDVGLDDKAKDVLCLNWHKKEAQREQRQQLAGCYVIHSTCTHLSAQAIWQLYMTLNQVESAFKDLKSQLGLRPVYHQQARRTAGHLFIGVLAYHLLIAIEHQLRQAGDHRSWGTLKKELSMYVRTTIAFNDKHGDLYHVRVSSTPESHHKEIFQALSVPLFNKRCFLFIGSRS
jgi:transposase